MTAKNLRCIACTARRHAGGSLRRTAPAASSDATVSSNARGFHDARASVPDRRYSPPCTTFGQSAAGSSTCTSTSDGIRTPPACTARVETRTVQAAEREAERIAGARVCTSTVARDAPSRDMRIAGSAVSCVDATAVENAPVSAADTHTSRHEAQRSAGCACPART
ncbi:hypothetical protein [Bifidobacterium castoris]|uniref:hypothetical protein n=1 Tax=Bifidobacterium castoris TaxID=2306972 RepID=UPI001F49B839|nr:hypothetical protein [Bifidobacterium castoris]